MDSRRRTLGEERNKRKVYKLCINLYLVQEIGSCAKAESHTHFSNEPPQEYIFLPVAQLPPEIRWRSLHSAGKSHLCNKTWSKKKYTTAQLIFSQSVKTVCCISHQLSAVFKTNEHVSTSATGLFICSFDLSCLALNYCQNTSRHTPGWHCMRPLLTTHPGI